VKPDGSSPADGLAELGEFGLIDAVAARLPASPHEIVGIGDDSAVLAAPDGNVVATVDFLLEGRHFRRAWSSGFDVGAKAAARSLADIAAMGAVPATLLVALALPGSLPASWALDFASGIAAECGRAGAGVAGGDTALAEQVIVSVTALGSLPPGVRAVRRAGARPGDVLAVCGPLGYAAAGLALLEAGAGGMPDLVAAHLRPSPPYAAGLAAARLGATAMIDTSDGLLADLGHIAEASAVAIDVSAGLLGVPGPLASAARLLAGKEAGRGAGGQVRVSRPARRARAPGLGRPPAGGQGGRAGRWRPSEPAWPGLLAPAMGADRGRGPLARRRVPAGGRAAGRLAGDRDGARGQRGNGRRRGARGSGRLAALPLAARASASPYHYPPARGYPPP
jgi:thiamine-monophosphate kinase